MLLWMDRDMRTKDNWALVHAQTAAKDAGTFVIAAYNLVPGFLGGTYRQHAFKIAGLREVASECHELGIPFFVTAEGDGVETLLELARTHAVGRVVTDFSPLRIQREWKSRFADACPVLVEEVDAHNIVPAWIASPKAEIGARTLRPKLHKLVPAYLEEYPKLAKQQSKLEVPRIDWDALLKNIAVDRSVPEAAFEGGMKVADAALTDFIENRLQTYGRDRNDAIKDAQSNLSPYLHYGMLSAARVAIRVSEAAHARIDTLLEKSRNAASTGKEPTAHESAAAFLEELIVRRELSDNFCFYNPETYDSVECFPAWAKATLDAHRTDTREHLYTDREFEEALTHDELWNAAQLQMVREGKMHGYLRMYWAKKLLEWTESPEEAMRIAIYLNDTYELDGRDPNGYAGIAWSIGGVHDRPWFNRPIFGLVRYMARSGADKKFDTKAYIARHLSEDSSVPL